MSKNLHIFLSDVHLGLKAFDPVKREAAFADFLNNLPQETEALYLLGDIFDFWYEYKYVIPKGFTRTLGALANLSDRGVKIFFFKGNHDLWTFGYLEKEVGFKILEDPTIVDIAGVKFCLAHGDELGDERGQKFLKGIFRNRFLQACFSSLHPRWAFAVALRWSKHNRLSKGEQFKFRGDKDPLYRFAVDFEKTNKADYFIFGHIHTPGNTQTPKGAGFYILGEWIHGCEYLVFNSQTKLLSWASAKKESSRDNQTNLCDTSEQALR
jgi:UDP-2,3-diacylglucosamine hydrolase